MSDRSTSSSDEPALPMKLPFDSGPVRIVPPPEIAVEMLELIEWARDEINKLGTLPLPLQKD